MKHVGSFISKLAVYGLACLVTSLITSVQAADGFARVQSLRGQAQYSEGGQWKTLTVGKVLRQGATIQTAANSSVDLWLRHNGPVVRVTSDTILGLDKLFLEETGGETVIDTRLDLRNGRILGNVKKMAAASNYQVKIPTGTVGIRGTDYDISTTGVVTVLNGAVRIQYTENGVLKEVIVNAGNTFTPPQTPTGTATVAETTPENKASSQVEWVHVQEIVSRIDPITYDLAPPITVTPLPPPVAPVIEQPLSPTTGEPTRP
jgi:hypothetical protein